MGWGDELMVTGQARVLQEADPRPVRVLYEKERWHEAWDHNPRIVKPGETHNFQELRPRVDGLRPYCTNKTAERWTWRAYQPPRGELYFTPAEKAFGALHAGRILVEPRVKPGASPNKNWGRNRWIELVRLARARGLPVAQVGPVPKYQLPGAEFIVTPTMRHAAAVMSTALAAVLHEGGLHHVAAAVGTKAVVIYGGFISPRVTGYPEQRSLFTGEGLGCGERNECDHCKAAMTAIAPEFVVQQLEEMLEEHRRSLAA